MGLLVSLVVMMLACWLPESSRGEVAGRALVD
jgi:hypothetical protein